MTTLHTPTDEEFLDRTPVIPEEADLSTLLRLHQERQDEGQVLSLEFKDFRVEVYLKS